MSREVVRAIEENYDALLEHAGAVHHPTHMVESHHPMHHGGHQPMHHAPVHHQGHHPTHGGHHAPVHEVHHHYQPAPPPPHGHGRPLPPPPPMEEPRREHWTERRANRFVRRREEEANGRDRLFPIGFQALQVDPGSEADIEVKPQVEFRGERLAIPYDIAKNFDILDVKVGKDSQLAASGTMPGACFGTTAVDVRMELDPAEPGIVITLRVLNLDKVNHQDFKAVMYGSVRE